MKFSGIQTLRGIAALMVVLHHLSVLCAKEKYFGAELFGGYFDSGFRGVDLFFVISGFIMMHTKTMTPNRTARIFAANRLMRIFVPYLPVFVLMTLIYVAVPSIAQGGTTIDFLYFIQNTFLLPRSNLETYVPVVAWTLTYELTFYLIFAVTFFSKARWAPVVFGGWMVACFTNCITPFIASDLMILNPLNLGFGIGIIAYKLHEAVPVSNKTAVFVLAAIGFCILLVPTFAREDSMLANLTFLLLSGLLCASSTEISKNVLSKIGDFSYSLYLLHYPILAFVFIAAFKLNLADAAQMYGLAIISIGTSLVISWCYYKLFEIYIHGRITGK